MSTCLNMYVYYIQVNEIIIRPITQPHQKSQNIQFESNTYK